MIRLASSEFINVLYILFREGAPQGFLAGLMASRQIAVRTVLQQV